MKNTKQLGKLRLFVYKSGDTYVGVCLELNLIVREKTQKSAIVHLIEMSKGYLETVLKENLHDEFLNEKIAFKYHLMYYKGIFANKILKNFYSIQVPVIDGKYAIPLAT